MATEFSASVDDVQVKGKPVDFPTLVPTLSKEEVNTMVNDIIPNNKRIPNEIMNKAIDFARERIAQGKSPFASKEEESQFKRMLEDGN